MSHKLVSLYIGDGEYYTRADTDNVLAEKDARIVSLNQEIARIQDKMCEDVFEGIMPSEHIVCLPLQQAAKYIAELKAQKAQAEDDCAYWKTMSRKCADDNEVMAKTTSKSVQKGTSPKVQEMRDIS